MTFSSSTNSSYFSKLAAIVMSFPNDIFCIVYSQRCRLQAQSNSVHIMKLARLYVCTMTSVLFFSSNSIGKTEQNTFLWLLCSFCCSHACFCDDDRVSSFNIQLTTSVTSLDLIRCPSPFSLSLCFLFAIQYVRMISYGVLCFNRLRECPRGLQRPWLIFFLFLSFCLFLFFPSMY